MDSAKKNAVGFTDRFNNSSSTGRKVSAEEASPSAAINGAAPRSTQELELIRIIGTGTFARVWLCRRRLAHTSPPIIRTPSITQEATSILPLRRSKSAPILYMQHASQLTNGIKKTQSCFALRVKGFVGPPAQRSQDEGKRRDDEPYYALKVMRASEMIRLRQVDHVLNERAILSKIDHSFIARLYASSFQ